MRLPVRWLLIQHRLKYRDFHSSHSFSILATSYEWRHQIIYQHLNELYLSNWFPLLNHSSFPITSELLSHGTTELKKNTKKGRKSGNAQITEKLLQMLPAALSQNMLSSALHLKPHVMYLKCPGSCLQLECTNNGSSFCLLYLFWVSLIARTYYAGDKKIWKILYKELRRVGSILHINNKIPTQCFTSNGVDLSFSVSFSFTSDLHPAV